MISDKQIIEQVLRGRVEDYRELMLRHHDRLFRLAYRMLGRREDAEDVVQDTFLQAYTKLSTCRDQSKFGAWARKIAVNICLRRFQRDVPTDDIDGMTELGSGSVSPVEDEILRRAELAKIQDALDHLPHQYRTVIVLRYGEELDISEIAELLNEKTGAIYTRLHRGRQMLASRLGDVVHEL